MIKKGWKSGHKILNYNNLKGMSKYPYSDENGDLKELLKQYEDLKSGKGKSFLMEDAFERIVDHFDEQDDLSSAMEAVDAGLTHYPYSSVLIIKKADLLIATRKYDEALEVLDQASLLDNSDIDIYILKTDAYMALDQQEKAVALLEDALYLFEGDDKINLLFELSDVYDDYEEFEKVFDCLKLILESEPSNEEALYKICFWTDFTGRNEESIRLHLWIIEETPYSELAWFNLAAAYQGLKLYEKSIDAYKYALVINEKFDYAYRNMADAYIRLRKYKDAIESLEKVMELSRPEDVIYEALGHCFDKLKNFAQARFYYKKASHLNQEDAKLYYKVASTYMHELNWSQAVKYLEISLKLAPRQTDFHLAMGECLMHMQDHRNAIEHLMMGIHIRPRSMGCWEALIRNLLITGSYKDAETQILVAEHKLGPKPLFLYYKVAILFANGKIKEASVQLAHALEKAPKLLKKLVHLNPSIVQNQLILDTISMYKRK